ncbi:MAG: FAD-dependent oxidoreductase [Armatimonadetes bacterium]|nr:FAD-dependent oxidoreductase [Armatimonadota bacterium]
MNVAIIGSGLMGSCAARELAKRGHEVTAFDQFELGHTLGSSHGTSRIVRKAYADRMYTEILLDAYPMWRELEEEAGERLLYEVGLLYFGSETAPEIVDQIEALTDLEVPFELKRGNEAGIALEPDEVGVFTPEAGWVHPPTVLGAARRIASYRGARFVQRKIERLDDLASFDRTVVTAGAWVRRFVDVPVSVRQATFAYVRGVHTGPVFIEARRGQVYGFPSEPGNESIKVGCHDLLREIDPDEPRGGPDDDALEIIRDFCVRRFGMDEPEIVDAQTCLYTRTPDEHFRIGSIDDRTVVASACSGHGFKFGPWIGKLLADMCEGKADVGRWPCFSL